ILFVYYRDTGLQPPQPADRIYPEFIWRSLPPGIAGLVIAAILAAAMSNLSAALNSLASTTIMDFYKPLTRHRHGESHYLALARKSTLVWGGILFAVGWIARSWGSVLEAGLSIASVLYGALLGVFLLGLLTRRATELHAMAGMSAGMLVMLYVKLQTPIAWTWYVMIGTAVTFGTGWLAALLVPRSRESGSPTNV
ncbi:MAG TPA: sodium:solute symporter, partial [Bryobacteraceae bacterium]|nr:sodium:solute symporter [Bryobacteraceae bacterium]